jgi:hypothetical protein
MARAKTRRPAAAPVRRKATAASAAAATPAGPAARIARVAKGKKPQYFADPATDKLLWMTISLMQELSVTRDRLDSVERLLDKKKLLKLRDIEKFVPSGTAAAERDARRGAYVDRVMRAVQADLEGVAAAAGDDDPVAAVSA